MVDFGSFGRLLLRVCCFDVWCFGLVLILWVGYFGFAFVLLVCGFFTLVFVLDCALVGLRVFE